MSRRSSKEVQALVDAAVRAGWELHRSKRHLVLRGPDSVTQVVLPLTPSDHRSLKNARALLRRHGIDC